MFLIVTKFMNVVDIFIVNLVYRFKNYTIRYAQTNKS